MSIKKMANESWKIIAFKGANNLRKKYTVSNFGRMASFSNDIYEDGKLLTGSLTSGYKTLNLHLEEGNGTFYVHREVAKSFCKKKSQKQKVVIHINHIKADNRAENLAWKTPVEASNHQQNSPKKLAYKAAQAQRKKGVKLTQLQVKSIKKTLLSPKRKLTYKQLAEKYFVSEMTIYRIKSGENWRLV